MKIIWELNDSDIKKITDIVDNNQTPFVANRIIKNINRKGIILNKDIILKNMFICLFTPQHGSDQDKRLSSFFNKEPFVLTEKYLLNKFNIENEVLQVLKSHGITPSEKVINSFVRNYFYLLQSNWEIITKLKNCAQGNYTKSQERDLADNIDTMFKGFGSIQSRRFLQTLGLTKYEIPINSKTIEWLKNFGFPISFSPIALQDKSFYHFISDGIQLLCEKATIYPCVFDAAIYSFYDKN